MDWLEITVTTAPGGIDYVAATLTAFGFDDLLIEDQQEFEDFLEKNRECWDYIDEELQNKIQGLSQIKLYLELDDHDGLTRMRAAVDSLRQRFPSGEMGPLELIEKRIPKVDWEESWKENYPPQEVGRTLVVLPYWLQDLETDGRLQVILDPGLTFGTGAHASTQMVMEAMESSDLQGSSCLDLGSGSGILSITALRLGAKSAIGVDIDPKAEDIARENAAYNGFGAPEFTALTGNVLTDGPLMEQLCQSRYDLVLVNIVADVIIALAPVLPKLMDDRSTLLCSGILDTRLADVTHALTQVGLNVICTYEKEDWRCIRVRR